MQFKFDPNQEFQLTAIDAAVGLLEGQPRIEVDFNFSLGTSHGAVANRLDLDEPTLLVNLNTVQANTGVPIDSELLPIEAPIETASGSKNVRFYNFSVEMETGTGKTYVYLRTCLELFRYYGLRKFIVVVPSVAIREGVLKDLSITKEHFEQLYGNIPYRYYEYDSSSLAQVRQFALSPSIEIMVMTIDSFNKASNVIRQTTDRLSGETPLHLVQVTHPVLILDEPQNMESELRVKALASLDPLFALRYSATHRNPYNLLYRLTPYDAYRQGLVKRIEVASAVTEDSENLPFARLERIDTKKKSVTARLSIHQLMKKGQVKEKTVTVRPGDSLETLSRRSIYAGYDIDEINAGGGFVRFANNVELRVREAQGADREALFEAQIRYTIEEHFRKQARLRPEGIKVLSLFFIDRVDNYVLEDGIIRRLFKKNFNELRALFPDWRGIDPERVQAAYFAQRKRRGGVVEFVDSVSGETQEDEAAYDLIMRDKERLLSLDEPVSFIFSHSALREGWDNPNVFQICTLNQTASEIKKRQEVGRGVRLARNQSGERIHDERVNVLTVVANESYENYVAQLQAEIEEEYGPEGVPPKPPNARKRGIGRLRKEFTLKPEFKSLWDRIKHKTRYSVRIDTEKLLSDTIPQVDKLKIQPPRVAITKAEVRVSQENVFEALQLSAAKTAVDLIGKFPLPDLVRLMADLMENTTPPVRLTRQTLLEIYRKTSNKDAALENPHEFASAVVGVLKEKLADHLVHGIQYRKINEWYEMTQFDAEVESWQNYLIPTNRSLYDKVECESEIERKFVEGLEKLDYVKLYVKLPSWFTVQTPVGEYNPDWAIVVEERDIHGKPTGKPLLYLVRETKSANWKTALRPSEKRKIEFGQRHFEDALGVNFKVVSNANEILT